MEQQKEPEASRASVSATILSGMQCQNALWSDPDIAGYLEKRGGKFTSWKRRFFVLQGSFLFFFISEQQLEAPLGLIPVEGCTIKETTDMGGKLRRYVFYVNVGSTHVGISRSETYILAAASRDLLEEWTEKLVLAGESRHELFGDLRTCRAAVGELRGILAEFSSEKRLFASLQGAEACDLRAELEKAMQEKVNCAKTIESVSIEADRQESALLQQLILWDIMSITDPGREPNAGYPTLTRLQDEVRYSDEIYRLLFKIGSFLQGEGLQDLKKESRRLLECLLRQVLDLIEDHHAKIRARAPRYSFPVDSKVYEDDFYLKVPEASTVTSKVEEEEVAKVQEVVRAGGLFARRTSTAAAIARKGSMSAQAVPSVRRASNAQQVAATKTNVQLAMGNLPKLFPEQKTYQLTRSGTRIWQAMTSGGAPIPVQASLPPSLKKRTQLYQDEKELNVLGSLATGTTISEVSEEEEIPIASSSSNEGLLRKRVARISPIFVSHFGPQTRPPSSQIKHDPVSTRPVPAFTEVVEAGLTTQGRVNRPNILAYVQGSIPRPKSVKPTRMSIFQQQQRMLQQQQRRSTSPSPESSKQSSEGSRGTSRSSTPPRSRSPVSLSTVLEPQVAAAAAAVAAEVAAALTLTGNQASTSGTLRVGKSVQKDEKSEAGSSSATKPLSKKISFISVDPSTLEQTPKYGRIRDFPVLVPSILNSEVGLSFPANTEIFSHKEPPPGDSNESSSVK